jgi:hypothetical protein
MATKRRKRMKQQKKRIVFTDRFLDGAEVVPYGRVVALVESLEAEGDRKGAAALRRSALAAITRTAKIIRGVKGQLTKQSRRKD